MHIFFIHLIGFNNNISVVFFGESLKNEYFRNEKCTVFKKLHFKILTLKLHNNVWSKIYNYDKNHNDSTVFEVTFSL